MAAKAAMAQGAPNYFTAEAMGFILAALFFNTLTAPVVKMTQNSEGGYDYNKWSVTERDFLQFLNLNLRRRRSRDAAPLRRPRRAAVSRRRRSTQAPGAG